MTERPPSFTGWETPPEVWEPLVKEFDGFLVDVACTRENCKGWFGLYHDEGQDGLTADWVERQRHWTDFALRGCSDPPTVFYMNPPWSKEIALWCRKALQESMRGITVVAILPVRTGTHYWREYVQKSNDIRYIGRVKYLHEGKSNGSPFEDSAVVVFRCIGTQSRKQDKAYPFEVKDER